MNPAERAAAAERAGGAAVRIGAGAHARGLRIYGATLTPFEDAAHWTPEDEAKRQALNEWIRTSGAYDAALDFAAVVQDLARPTTSRSEYDSGDHLHPSPSAYAAMANSIDLGLFRLPP